MSSSNPHHFPNSRIPAAYAELPPLAEWQRARELPQSEFFTAALFALSERIGRRAKYRDLAELTHYSLSRVQKWATAGTAQEPLAITVRHHIWLAVTYAEAPR
jgi:hypothetical protein